MPYRRSTRDFPYAVVANLVNRAVAIIKPRRPYLDWATSIPGPADDVTLDEMRTDCTAILIPDFDTPAESEAFVAGLAGELFKMELEAWDRDPTTWPEDRSYDVFRQWFDLEIHSIVVDAANDDMSWETF